MMEEWKEYKLGDLIVLSSGGTPNKSNGSYWNGDIPWISAKAMYDDYLYSSDITITREGLDNGSKLAPVNSILLLTRGSGLFNRIPVCLVKSEMAFNQDVKCIESKDKNVVSNFFLFYWLIGNKRAISNILETTGIGAGKIDTERLKNLPINLPPIQRQQVLIKFAESLMLKIEVNRRINDNLEQQAQALFKSWFVDFEPFKDGEFIESELGMIPKGWKVESLTSFGKIVCGKTPSKAESTHYGGNIPFIKIPDMHNNVYVLQSEDSLSELGDKSQIAKRIPPYSVLVSCIATVGLVSMNVRTCHTNQQINTIIPNFAEYRFYLYQKLVSLKDYLINLGRGGTATLNVNTRQFGNIEIVKPSDNVLSDYHQRVSCLFDKIEANSKESRRLAELRDTLLPRLMSGELKVNEIKA